MPKNKIKKWTPEPIPNEMDELNTVITKLNMYNKKDSLDIFKENLKIYNHGQQLLNSLNDRSGIIFVDPDIINELIRRKKKRYSMKLSKRKKKKKNH